MTAFILKYKYLLIIFFVVLGLSGASLIPSTRTDPDVRNYIPGKLLSKINTEKIESYFGDQELVLIVFKDSTILTRGNLSDIYRIDRDLNNSRYFSNVISPFSIKRIYGDQGIMLVDPAVSFIPSGKEQTDSLRKLLTANPLAMGTVISDDFTMAAIAVTLKSGLQETESLKVLEDIANNGREGNAAIYYGGFPYIRKYIMEDVRRDGIILIPLALIIMLVFLWLAFRDWRGVILPFSVVLLSIAVSMGMAPLAGWKISVISLLVPIMLIAVANDYGIHMMAKYHELIEQNHKRSRKEIVSAILKGLKKPIVLTGLTTVAGLLGLLAHSIRPARHVGILASAGIAFAVILTLFMLPSWLSIIPKPAIGRTKGSKKRVIDKMLKALSDLVTRKPLLILILSAVCVIVLSTGIFRVKVDANQENFFPSHHNARIASELINENFGGSQSIAVMLEDDIKDPEILSVIDRWTSEIKSMDGVGDAYSISTVIREMTGALYDKGEEGYRKIPRSREAVAQVLELYNMSGDPDDFERLVDFDYSRALIMVRFDRPETALVRAVLDRFDELSARDGTEITKGGYAYIMLQFADNIIKGQVYSLLFAVATVLLILSMAFRSVKWGLLSVLPVVISVVLLFGIMGFTGITLNSATALLSSVMIGVGIDYTIHFTWRYMDEFRTGRDMVGAVRKTISTTGKGIVYNAFSVITGFSVLIFSGFTSIRFFGFLVVISIAICLVSALVLIPSLIITGKPIIKYSNKEDFVKQKITKDNEKNIDNTDRHDNRAEFGSTG